MGLVPTTGCKSSSPAESAPSTRPTPRSAPPTGEVPSGSSPNKPPSGTSESGRATAGGAALDPAGDEAEPTEGAAEAELEHQLAFGPDGTHAVVLTRSDDGTTLDLAVTFAAGTPGAVSSVQLGSIQGKHGDQLTGLNAVETCQKDDDPALELCIRYSADPLGSTRKEPYEAEVVYDWDGTGLVRLR